jgi:fatty-acyl-CoA synthase
MDHPLLISSLIDYAAETHGHVEVVSHTVEGPVHRYNWGDVRERSAQLAHSLSGLSVGVGDRVGTIAWNGYRHLEIYYGVSGMGAVCHTMNPRLHPDQLSYIINHAEDRVLFVDLTFVPLVAAIADRLETVEHVVVMTGRETMPESPLSDLVCYEELLEDKPGEYDWPILDENAAASLCYTSGTTGNPKGVLYSHRSTVLHAFAASLPDALGVKEGQAMLPVVPMFHANAWGAPYSSAILGAKLVFTGPHMDGEALTRLMRDEDVVVSSGVPTIWMGLIDYWRTHDTGVPSLEVVGVGGAAPPRSMIRAFEEEFGIEFRQGWGMTETSPIGSLNVPTSDLRQGTLEERLDVQVKQGRRICGIEWRIVDEEGATVPRDGKAIGELQVRGPWVCSSYYKHDEDILDAEGWFSTGDIATLDAQGYMQITDRAKDVIKSGGEWISSIDLENVAMGHPDVALAAGIGIPDAKWTERPLLIVQAREGSEVTREDVLTFLEGKVAKWWIPEDVVFVESIPVGGTGKVQKTRLRELYEEPKSLEGGA